MSEDVSVLDDQSAAMLETEAALAARRVLEESSITEDTRTVEMEGTSYVTNIPASAELFDNSPYDDWGGARGIDSIRPKGIDDVQPGIYFVEEQTPHDEGYKFRRELKIIETEYGKALTLDSLDNPSITIGSKAKKFFQRFGFAFEQKDGESDGELGQLSAVPSPETVQQNAELFNVDIAITDSSSVISPEEYIKYYADGKYPVAASGSYYFHDIEDDHFPGVILGGEELRDSLSGAAELALQSRDSERIGATTDAIDKFTAALTGVIAGSRIGDAYGPELGRQTVRDCAKDLDISREKADEIVDLIRSRALKAGYAEVQPLK